jgi:23S rRNA (uracil1939-C5)-methyltransferase
VTQELRIERLLGQRGEGIARTHAGLVFVPYALPGETILADVSSDRGRLIEILTPSPHRIEAFCPYYGICGGCAVQALAAEPYADWKRSLLVDALRHAGLVAPVAPLIDVHGTGRRRATFHARYDSAGKAMVGFMQARAHEVVNIEACPILAPSMQGAPVVARAIAAALGIARKPLDISVTATLTGLDIDIRGHGELPPDETQALVRLAETYDLARLSNHGERIVERRAPMLRMGRAEVVPPPGAFLQATEAGELALADQVFAAAGAARQVADLFAGLGTFSLRLAEKARVHAVDGDHAAVGALAKAARSASNLQPAAVETRDLFRRPLAGDELEGFDALVFDPPRAGAEAQAQALAASAVPLIIAVSCNAQTFARDAALLVSGDYLFESATPIDQFRYSPHLEIVGLFRRPATKRRRRRLLG